MITEKLENQDGAGSDEDSVLDVNLSGTDETIEPAPETSEPASPRTYTQEEFQALQEMHDRLKSTVSGQGKQIQRLTAQVSERETVAERLARLEKGLEIDLEYHSRTSGDYEPVAPEPEEDELTKRRRAWVEQGKSIPTPQQVAFMRFGNACQEAKIDTQDPEFQRFFATTISKTRTVDEAIEKLSEYQDALRVEQIRKEEKEKARVEYDTERARFRLKKVEAGGPGASDTLEGKSPRDLIREGLEEKKRRAS